MAVPHDEADPHGDDDRLDGAPVTSDRREALHDLTGVLAAAALRLEVVRRRHGSVVDSDPELGADLARIEAAVAEARRLVVDLQVGPEAAPDVGGR